MPPETRRAPHNKGMHRSRCTRVLSSFSHSFTSSFVGTGDACRYAVKQMQQMRRATAATPALLLLLAATVCLYQWFKPFAALSRAIAQCAGERSESHLTFSGITRFEWGRVFVFPPYTTEDEIHRCLQVSWPAVSATTVSSNDSITLIVFVHKGSVACWLEHPRGQGDFSSDLQCGGLSKADAVFEKATDEHGWVNFVKIKNTSA
jgi:hypothetical protein